MRQRCISSLAILVLVLGALLTAGAVSVWAFAEEELGFRDQDGTTYPPAGDYPDGRVSTFHDDLTWALAIAAGFSATDTQTLRVWDQLVDSEVLPSEPNPYVYGNAGFFAPPKPLSACIGKNHARQIWPTGSFDPETSAVTSRFGPYSPFFHFPHLGSPELAALRGWAWGSADTLQGYEAYAWGRPADFTLMQALQNNGCLITRTVTISMPVAAGSLQAFATYLHSLGDAYSHADCLSALDDLTPPAPWGTHTVPILGDPAIVACDYNPSHPLNDDAHGREFGAVYTDTQRTIAAALAVYGELSARSLMREGVHSPLPVEATLIVGGTSTTLGEAIRHFVTNWDYDEPARRREAVDDLLVALDSQPRTLISRSHLPLVSR